MVTLGLVLGVLGLVGLLVAFLHRVECHRRVVLSLLRRYPKGAFGLELIEKSEGVLRRGTLYVLLAGLEGEGLVASWESHGRRKYKLTEKGRCQKPTSLIG